MAVNAGSLVAAHAGFVWTSQTSDKATHATVVVLNITFFTHGEKCAWPCCDAVAHVRKWASTSAATDSRWFCGALL